MDNNKKYFYLPFATLLIYTFGVFFLFNTNAGGVFLSPGYAPLGVGATLFVIVLIIVVVIVLLFLSAKKDSGGKNEW